MSHKNTTDKQSHYASIMERKKKEKLTIAKANSMANTTDKESLFDSMIMIDFWNKIHDADDTDLTIKVHGVIRKKLIECMKHWQGDSLFSAFLEKGLFPLDDPTKQVGDIVRFGKMVGVVSKIEGKLFTVHTTEGQDLSFVAEED
jgi:hypothetical protein